MLRVELRRRVYHDSIVLMLASQRMAGLDGVEAAMAAMATPLNLEMLRDAGLWSDALAEAGADDLVIAARGPASVAALALAEAALSERPRPRSEAGAPQSRTLRTAAAGFGSNLAVIATPGEHAAWLGWDALQADLDVFCFSDNVSLADEVLLKDEALRRGRLFLGPDAGTCILDGVGLGFWNAVPRGPAGIVGASGTGIQELSCLLALQGVGVSQAIGVGGRDLSPEVGGRMAAEAIRRLDEDVETEVIAVVSKRQPGELQLPSTRKPLLKGLDLTALALELGGGRLPEEPGQVDWEGPVDGIFSGGTLRDEAVAIWGSQPRFSAVDYGADEYTRGRPHPMIDNTLRLEAIRRSRGLVYLDVVLGRGAHPDPSAELAPALAGRPAVVVLVGTEADPQRLSRQRAAFEAAGAQVFLSNANAARALLR